MLGMAIAVLATVFGPRVNLSAGLPWIIGAMLAGGSVGLYAARKVQMTQMPELVALMHSLVGLAAMLVGFANYIDPAAAFQLSSTEKSIHETEIYLGILIGAVTFAGSVIAFRQTLRQNWRQAAASARPPCIEPYWPADRYYFRLAVSAFRVGE